MDFVKFKKIFLLLFSITIIGNNLVFASSEIISGLKTANNGNVFCNYDSSTNNCIMAFQDTNYYIFGNQEIYVSNKKPNLIIPANIKLIVKDINSGNEILNTFTIYFKNFETIKINQGKSLTILNDAISSLDLVFKEVSNFIIPVDSNFNIIDNTNLNFSEILKENEKYQEKNLEAAKSEHKIFTLSSGNIDLSETNIDINGNINFDLNRFVILSNELTKYKNLEECQNNLEPFVGLREGVIEESMRLNFPSSYEFEDEESDDYIISNSSSTICYNYLNFTRCDPNTRPYASYKDSVYLCFDFKEPTPVIFSNINAGNNSNISINTGMKIKRNIHFDPSVNKFYYNDRDIITDILSSLIVSFEEDGEGDNIKPFHLHPEITFKNYKGKVPFKLNTQGIGDIIFETCDKVDVIPEPKVVLGISFPQIYYDTCKFILIKPEDINIPIQKNVLGIAQSGFLSYDKQCGFTNIATEISNYLIANPDQNVTPLVFGNIIKTANQEQINPNFTSSSPYGIYDIDEELKSGIKINNNGFFIIESTPSILELNLLNIYLFKFKLNKNLDLNYSDVNLSYPFKLYK